MTIKHGCELGLVADQEEPRARVAFRRDLQSFNDHERRVIAAHGVHRQRVGRGQGTLRGHAAARRQARTAPFSAFPAATISRPS